MKLLNSRPILYFAVGLLLGGSLSYLFEFPDKYSLDLEPAQLGQLLNLLLHLTIWGVMLGGVTVLLSRGLAQVFLETSKKPHQQPQKKP